MTILKRTQLIVERTAEIVQVYGVQIRTVHLGQSRIIGQIQVGRFGVRFIAGRRIVATARTAVTIRTVRICTLNQIETTVLDSIMHLKHRNVNTFVYRNICAVMVRVA